MPMDSSTTGQDHINDPSFGRGIVESEVSTERLGKKFESLQVQLGEPMQIIERQLERINMVDRKVRVIQWPGYQEADRVSGAEGDGIRRRFGHGMGNSIRDDPDKWVLGRGRKRNLDQCSRTEDNSICSETACRKIQKLNHPHPYRQYDGIEACQKIRGDSISPFTDLNTRDSADCDRVQSTDTLFSHSRSQECSSRQTEQNYQTNLRMDFTKKILPEDSTSLEGDGRRICHQREQTTETILEPQSRSGSTSMQCVQAAVAEGGTVCSPALEAGSCSTRKGKERQGEVNGVGDTDMAHAILVANGDEHEQRETLTIPNQQETEVNRLEIIRLHNTEDNISEAASQYLENSNKKSTHKHYDALWRKCVKWCSENEQTINPMEYNPNAVLECLVANNQFSSQHLNTMRSAIASVYRVIHPDKPPLASNERILQFFRAKRRKIQN